jgi:hypothetical protein
MKAWVVTIVSLDDPKSHPDAGNEVVIALVSARRGASFIKTYVETLVHILCRSLDEQKTASAAIKLSSSRYTNDDGGCRISFYNHPYIVQAQKSDVIRISNINGVSWLKWKGIKYSRFEVDPLIHRIKKVADVDPPTKECPQANFGLSDRAMFANNRLPTLRPQAATAADGAER